MADIESLIDEGVQAQIRELAVQALLGAAGDIPLAKLGDLRESDRYRDVANQVTLQELIDAYLDKHELDAYKLVTDDGSRVEDKEPEDKEPEPEETPEEEKEPEPEPEETPEEILELLDDAKEAPEAPKKSGGGGGGSAEPGRKVNFRDADAKARYSEAIEKVIRDRAGEPVSSTELKSLCGGSPNQVREILMAKVESGQVVYTGLARATRYYWKAKASKEVIALFEKAESNKKAS